MQISDLKKIVGVLALGIGFALQTQSTLAFDASKVLQNDSSSNEVFEFFHRFRKDGKSDEAIQVLQYAAEQGNSAAQWKLARSYQTGDGVERNPLRAFDMFQKIAAQYPQARPDTPNWQFSADALVALGNYYKTGIEGTAVRRDPDRAQMMFTTAAMVFRHPDAQFELGRMQLFDDEGYGQHRLGIRNLSLANEKGHMGAKALLGYALFVGEYITRNPVRGLKMLSVAKSRADTQELGWISPLYDEAVALATPEQRSAAFK